MKVITFNVAGQEQVFEKYESEEEYQKFQQAIEKVFGKPVVDPSIEISKILSRRYTIIDRTAEQQNPA
jgi:hypothetical protein